MEGYHILIVEDDKEIREGIEIYLKNQGYIVFQAADGVEGIEKIRQQEIHLAIVDIMMPRMDGITMMMKVRESGYEFPVIMLSAKSEEVDKIMGLNMGADDYVTKPFSLPILYAKAEALTGRVWGSDAHIQKAGSLSVNPRSHEVRVQGRPVNLPPKEYELLLFFLENPGRVYSRDQLLIRFWGYDFDGNERVVDSHIKKLRKALGDCGCAIRTVRKSGYRMEVTG